MSLNHRSAKYYELSTEDRRKYDEKMSKRPPLTDLQKLAQKENFALFQLTSMKSTASGLANHHCRGVVDVVAMLKVIRECDSAILAIKSAQYKRMVNRINKKENKNG